MYIIKVMFNEASLDVDYQVIDSALCPPVWYHAMCETRYAEQNLGYEINEHTFGLEAAKQIANFVLCDKAQNLRYQYTDGFLPFATFVFEYNR